MPYCPECGGEMLFDAKLRRHVCKNCGLSLTEQELIEMREAVRSEVETDEEKRKRKHKEYLKWWFSKK